MSTVVQWKYFVFVMLVHCTLSPCAIASTTQRPLLCNQLCMSTNVFSGWCQVAPRIVPVTSTVKADCPGFTSRRGHAVFSLPAASVYRAALT